MAEQETNLVLKEQAHLVKQYAKNLLDDKRANQFATHVSILAQKEPKLKMCNPDSILAAMMACVHLDLMPNTPEQLAFLIPYKNKSGGFELQFQIGYKGMVELAYRSGQIVSIAAEPVFKEDQFKVLLGTERKIIHDPNYEIDRSKNFDNITHVYATAKLLSGEIAFDVMTRAEIDKIRDNSKARSGPWQTWPEVMAKKTVVKRLLKFLPTSKQDRRLQLATVFDSWAEAGKLGIDDKTGEVKEAKARAQENERAKEIAKQLTAAEGAVNEEGKKVDDPKPDEPKSAEEQPK